MTPARLSTDALRQAAAKRVEETTLRDTADEIGMSWSGLASFISGGSLQRKTRVKLVEWFYKRSARSTAPPREEVETALAQLIVYVQDQSKPRSVRDRRLQEVIERLKE